MRFEILNVEHGFCAYALGLDGGAFLFDCGHGTVIRPSTYLPMQGITRIRSFFVMNYDEDHISDLPNVRRNLYIDSLMRNTSMNSSQIRSLKEKPISNAMNELLGMIDSFAFIGTPEQFAVPGLSVSTFYNYYPNFIDTNNLSLLTFLDVGSMSFVLGGDLERRGWLQLLQNPYVRSFLTRVDVFVASHHGRESGYCAEVFNYCRPKLIVISDGTIQYDTQRMASTYSQHASGEFFRTFSGQQFRKVVTTRKDGNIFWEL